MKSGMEILEEEAPTEDALTIQRRVSQILAIRPDVKFTTTKQHRAKLLEGFNDGKKFLFHGGVVALRSVELATIESNWSLVLDNDGA